MTKMKYLGALGLLLAGCGGQAAEAGGTSKQEQSALKKLAAESVAAGTATGDACATNGWYGDSVCDSFCADKDTDCVVTAPESATVCAEFEQVADGKCSRPPSDPCIFQDPDCGQATPPSPGGGVACAAISEAPDGKCSRPVSDACRWQDPDCVPAVACPAIAGIPDGVCSLPYTDPCRGIDPDCIVSTSPAPGGPGGSGGSGAGGADGGGSDPNPGVACAEYVMSSDGVCSLPPDDPCLFHDPDCKPAK
jgi:hypothetical protein